MEYNLSYAVEILHNLVKRDLIKDKGNDAYTEVTEFLDHHKPGVKYRVSWTEDHTAIVEAQSKEEAYDKALNEDHNDSLQGLHTTEIKLEKEDQ